MIELKNVKKTYHTGETAIEALRGVSFKVDKGEFLSIAGPSGSGKTTVLNIIGTLDTHDGGDVILDGIDISQMDKKTRAGFRRDNIGFVFQTFNLIPVLSAYENVAFALYLLSYSEKEIMDKTMAILFEVGLNGLEKRRPNQLSGGQQQRVAIARALVKNPLLVLADEPTANLDSETGSSIINLMKGLNKKYNTTFIFSTHDRMVMDNADRVIHLHDGNVGSDSGGPN